MNAKIARRQQLLLWGAGLVGVVAVIPYAFTLQAAQIAKAQARSGLSTLTIAAISVLQTAVLLAIAVFLGARAMRALGLRAPLTEAIAGTQPVGPVLRPFAARAALVGLAGGILIAALDSLVFLRAIPALAAVDAPHPAWWKGALAALYGAVDEELLLRFALLGLLAWGLRALVRARGLPAWIFWTANVLAAVLFGLGHLPATAAIVPLTPLVVVRAIVLNGVVGVAFGWLYRRDGLEAAMLAHGTADVVLHVVTPLLMAQR